MKTHSALLHIILISFSLNAWGQTPVPIEDDNSSIQKWASKVQRQPSRVLYRFNLGVAYHKQKKYKKALYQYKKVILAKSRLAPICRYYRAKIFNSAGYTNKAKKELTYIDLKTVPKNLRTNVLILKNSLFAEDLEASIDEENEDTSASKSSEEEQRFFASLNLSRGRNSNPLFSSDISNDTEEQDTQSRWTANLSYTPLIKDSYDWKVKYSYSQTDYKENSDANSSYHNVSLPLAIYTSKYRWTLIPEFIADTYAGESFSENSGATIEGTYRKDSTYWSISYQYLKANVKSSDYSYLNGHTQALRGSMQTRWHSSQISSALIFNKYSYQDTDDLASSYNSLNLDLNYTHYWGSWELNIGGFFEARLYSLATNDSEARSDRKSTGSLQLAYNYNNNLSLSFDFSKTRNESNFNSDDNNRSYEQTISLFGLNLYY